MRRAAKSLDFLVPLGRLPSFLHVRIDLVHVVWVIWIVKIVHRAHTNPKGGTQEFLNYQTLSLIMVADDTDIAYQYHILKFRIVLSIAFRRLLNRLLNRFLNLQILMLLLSLLNNELIIN